MRARERERESDAKVNEAERTRAQRRRQQGQGEGGSFRGDTRLPPAVTSPTSTCSCSNSGTLSGKWKGWERSDRPSKSSLCSPRSSAHHPQRDQDADAFRKLGNHSPGNNRPRPALQPSSLDADPAQQSHLALACSFLLLPASVSSPFIGFRLTRRPQERERVCVRERVSTPFISHSSISLALTSQPPPQGHVALSSLASIPPPLPLPSSSQPFSISEAIGIEKGPRASHSSDPIRSDSPRELPCL